MNLDEKDIRDGVLLAALGRSRSCADTPLEKAAFDRALALIRELVASEQSAPNPVLQHQSIPSGKGIFTGALARGIRHIGTPHNFASKLQQGGVDWVAVFRIWQYRNKRDAHWNTDAARLQDYLDAMAEAEVGKRRFVWGWPVANKVEAFVDYIVQAALDIGAHGVINDAENEFNGRPREAEKLQRLLTEACHAEGLTVGFTSYGAPWNYPKMPFNIFSGGTDFVMPQIYDMNNGLPEDYPERSVFAWEGFASGVPIVPIAKTFNTTPRQIEEMLKRTPVPHGALGFWQARQTDSNEWKTIGRAKITPDGVVF